MTPPADPEGAGRRLLTISPYLTSVPMSGGTRRIHYLNRHIADRGWDVAQVSIGPIWPGLSRDARLIRHSQRYREFRHWTPAVPLTNRVLKQFGGAQVAASLLPSLVLRSRLLDRQLRERRVVMLEHPHAYGFVRDRLEPGTRLVLDAHNIESDLSVDRGNPIAQRANRELFVAEQELMQRADLVFFCSEEDRRRAVEKFGLSEERLRVAPNGTDVGGIQVPGEAERVDAKRTLGLEGRPVALFAGSHWPPNIEAAHRIVELASAMPDVTFLVIGRVGEALPAERPPNMRVPGFVPHPRPYAAAADISLNPMLSGSGSNIKVFDYLAHGLPVVSTPFGIRGLKAEDSAAVVACRLDKFPESIRDVLDDAEIAARRLAARSLAETYDWRAIAGQVARELDNLP